MGEKPARPKSMKIHNIAKHRSARGQWIWAEVHLQSGPSANGSLRKSESVNMFHTFGALPRRIRALETRYGCGWSAIGKALKQAKSYPSP